MARLLRVAALAGVALALFQLVFPFLEAGFRNGHDMSAHVTYARLFDDAIRQGQFPVRWIEGPRRGYSQPLFNFYQVGFYYLVEAVHLVVPRLSLSLTLTLGLLWWAGAAFTFLWLKRLGALPAALGALMFALSPYLIQDVFVRAAYPEVAAIVLVPGALWALDRLLTTGRLVFMPVLALLVALMAICHLPATLIASVLLAAHVLYLFLTHQMKPASGFKLAAAAALAIGLSAFYVLPALLELKHVNSAKLISYDQDYHQHFVLPKDLDGTRFGPLDWMSFQLGFTQWVVVVVGPFVLAGALVRKRFRADSVGILVYLGTVIFALFMMNPVSVAVWDRLHFLSFIQFPWRFFLTFLIGCAAMGAFLLALVHDRRAQAVLVLVALALQVPLYLHYQNPDRLMVRDEFWNIDDPGWRRNDAAERLAFYQSGYDPAGITASPESQPDRSMVAAGEGTLREVSARDDRLTLAAQSAQGMRVLVNRHYFPGWAVRLDDRAAPFTVSRDDDFMLVSVPPGSHRIEARFENTPIRTVANTITVVSAVLLLVSLALC